MPLTINLRHLEKKALHLEGDLSAEELDLASFDELVQPAGALRYALEAERLGKSILVQGSLQLDLTCTCARCLKLYAHEITLDEFALDLLLEGEDKVEVVNDCVDLTPFIREDILLAFPQHPLCDTDCSGLPITTPEPGRERKGVGDSSAWSALNKLKF